jgi:endonuclease G, mitochondrial
LADVFLNLSVFPEQYWINIALFYKHFLTALKFRRNHLQASHSKVPLIRMAIMAFFLLASLYGLFMFLGNRHQNALISDEYLTDKSGNARTFLPSSKGEVVHHSYYSLSYIEKHEQAEWTAHLLSREMLRIPNVPRSNYFNPDPFINTGSAVHADYSGSGYTRGHLVPAGDMAHDKIAMEESFYMSNMSPQLRAFNNGVWRELEENVRDWAFSKGSVFVITGPVLTDSVRKKIGKNRVSVPDSFFKVVLSYYDKHRKAVAFIIPNARSEQPLQDYMVSVDEAERITGIDFFCHLLDDIVEEQIESVLDKAAWPVSEKRFQLRLSKWNNE